MLKDLIKITEKNIQYLKSCLDLTEAHITWGTKNVKKKYSKIKETLQLKLKEQYIDKRILNDRCDEEIKGSIEFDRRCKEILGI
jgi:hypothetical protein